MSDNIIPYVGQKRVLKTTDGQKVRITVLMVQHRPDFGPRAFEVLDVKNRIWLFCVPPGELYV